MREAIKITVPYQFANMLIMHIAAAGITFVFGMIAFWYFTEQPVFKEIISCIFMFVYASVIYLRAKKFGRDDSRPYTPLKSYQLKGFALGAGISVVTAVLLVIFKLLWANFNVDGSIMGVIPTIVNFIFFYWSYPYNGIMGLSQGLMTWYSIAAMMLLPIAASGLGYLAGCNKFELAEKMESFMYEKEEE